MLNHGKRILPFVLSLSISIPFAELNSADSSLGADNQIPGAAPVEKPKKLIFLHFYNQAAEKSTQDGENLEWVESSIGKAIHESIQNRFRYEKVADARWQEYMRKNGWQKRDLYNVDKLQRMGLDFGADGIVYGKFSVLSAPEGDYLHATGSILSVIDRDIIATHSIKQKINPRLFKKVEQLAVKLGKNIASLFLPSNSGALRRSAVLPGWGQYYKQRKTAAYIWGGTFIAASGFLIFSSLKYLQTKIEFDNYDPGTVTTSSGETAFVNGESAARREFNELQENNERWETITLVTAAVVGTVYLFNLADAWFFDGDYRQLRGTTEAGDISFQFNSFPISGFGQAYSRNRVGFGQSRLSHSSSVKHTRYRASNSNVITSVHFEARLVRRF